MAKPAALFSTLFAITMLGATAAECDPLKPKDVSFAQPAQKRNTRKSPVVKSSFSPFTGQVAGNRVRLRLHPDLDGSIAMELNKSELLSVLGQEGEFYVVSAPVDVKAYIFRSFVLDGVVEGNRVNVRLAPDLEAPIIGHLNSGDAVNGVISKENKKWLEITPPATCSFYVAKDYIEKVGDLGYIAKMQKRKETVKQLFEAAILYAGNEMEKEFEEIDYDRIKQGFLTIANDYSDFPKQATQAKQELAKVQEGYLEKRIAYLEEKASLATSPQRAKSGSLHPRTSGIHSWEPIENALYSSWAQLNQGKSKNQFYEEQKIIAVSLSGVLETYSSPVRNKPGDYIIKHKNLPVAYVYSTSIDLSKYVGQKVKLHGSPRSNNNFAFPAYYVHEVE